MGKFYARESEGIIRAWDKASIMLEDRTVYTKRVCEPVKKIERAYNSKGELVGVDILDHEFNTLEVIQNKIKGHTIVIIHCQANGKKYKGVSKCHREDIFNPNIGYCLAYLRAMNKMVEARLKEEEELAREDIWDFLNL